LLWVPWLLFLVALRIEVQEDFDFRPLISFAVVLTCTGAGFLSMGLFFSSLTSNQIVSAVLTFVGMLGLLVIYFMLEEFQERSPGSVWISILTHVSFINLWFDSLDGKIMPQFLLFHISATVFWLFLTLKVLEARKWR
jgi:hypothetical protein